LNVIGGCWKLGRLLSGRKKDGFKFAPVYHEHMWTRYARALAGTAIVNNFQIFGSAFWRQANRLDIEPYFYIDGTLNEYFTSYAEFDTANIDKDTTSTAITLEREGYARANRIIVMSQRTANDLSTFYGISQEKISLVCPAANLPDNLIDTDVPSSHGRRDEFVLGFVGLYPIRKGLDRLAAAVSLMRRRNLPVRLRVIGRCPEEIQKMDGVDYLGIIQKSTHMSQFLEAIGDVDLGCQLSRAELTGIATLEFLRLGIPILATDVGGMPEIMNHGAGLMVSPNIGQEELAETISELVTDRDRYTVLRASAERRRGWASWLRAARELDAALSQPAGSVHL
jgi:glycosyltransferase involved in cell wall biosynthesis